MSIEFLHWIAETPAASMFNVPKDCPPSNKTADPSVGCHARSTIVPPPACGAPPAMAWPDHFIECVCAQMARAQDWVNHHVPYSQTGRYAGYRTDCSGS